MARSKLLSIIISICLLAPCATITLAQGSAGQISGTVADPTGARLPSASVTVTGLDTSLVRQAATNENGDFTFQLLPPGQYTVKVTAQGFKSVMLEKVVVNITQTTALDVTLEQVAGLAQDSRRKTTR